MNHIGGIRVVGAFMALGAYIRMASCGVHRREVMIDAGYRFIPMTLEAGDPGPDRIGLYGAMALPCTIGGAYLCIFHQQGESAENGDVQRCVSGEANRLR